MDATEVAKIVRAELKKAFPSTSFKVNTSKYSGGSSIRVRWIDGPTHDAVKAVAGKFHGADFDGMQDLKTYNHTGYGNDFIFFERDYSDARMQEAIDWYLNNWANPSPVALVHSTRNGKVTCSAYIETRDYQAQDIIMEHLRAQAF